MRDGGWNVRCEAGVVLVDDLTQVMYCLGDNSEVVCYSELPATATLHTCASSACIPGDTFRYLETVAEFDAFDSPTLCQ